MNLALVQGFAAGLGATGLSPALDPDPVAAASSSARASQPSPPPIGHNSCTTSTPAKELTMTTDTTYVIAGASMAGAKAAETLRAEGFDGRVILIGTETELPYERPPLSKDYLLGKAERRDDLRPPAGVVRRVGGRPAASAHGHRDRPGRPQVTLDDGSRVGYFGKLLLTTGSSATPLPVPGRRPGPRALPAQRSAIATGSGTRSRALPGSRLSAPAGSAWRRPRRHGRRAPRSRSWRSRSCRCCGCWGRGVARGLRRTCTATRRRPALRRGGSRDHRRRRARRRRTAQRRGPGQRGPDHHRRRDRAQHRARAGRGT